MAVFLSPADDGPFLISNHIGRARRSSAMKVSMAFCDASLCNCSRMVSQSSLVFFSLLVGKIGGRNKAHLAAKQWARVCGVPKMLIANLLVWF